MGYPRRISALLAQDSISSLHPYREELGSSQPFPLGSVAQGPPDHFEPLLLSVLCPDWLLGRREILTNSFPCTEAEPSTLPLV